MSTIQLRRDALRAARRCPHCFSNRQPETTYGSPEDVIERGVARAARLTEQFSERIGKALEGKTTERAINGALSAVASSFPLRSFSQAIEDELLMGLMLGALDSEWEATDDDRPIEVATFKVDPRFSKRPLADALELFKKKGVVTRDVFDEMTDAAKQRAFTVAGFASESMIGVVKSELANRIEQGSDLRDFRRFAETRLAGAGWTPANASHVETIFRTNVLGAYNGGRHRQMTQPDVLALRPYVQILTPNDGPPRQRPAHQKTHLRVFRLDDPSFEPPPWDFNCRCRSRSMSQRQLDKSGLSVTDGSFLKSLELPAPGFGGGGGIEGDFFGPKVKKIPPPPKEPPPEKPPAPPPERPAPAPRRPRKAPAPKPPPPAPPPPAPKPRPEPKPRKPKAVPPPKAPKPKAEPKPKASPLEKALGKKGTVVSSNTRDGVVPANTQKAVLKGLQKSGYADDPNVLTTLELTDFAAPGDIKPSDNRLPPGTGGCYFPGGSKRMRIKTNRGAIDDSFVRSYKLDLAKGTEIPYNTANLATNPDEALEMIVVHEYAHHIHTGTVSYGSSRADQRIRRAFEDSDRQDVSDYGRQSHEEYFAEAFAAYRYYPKAWLRRHAPKAVEMVEDVLRMQGLPL